MTEADTDAVGLAKALLSTTWADGSERKLAQALINVLADRDELLVSVEALTETIADGSGERDKLIAEREHWRARAECGGDIATVSAAARRVLAIAGSDEGIGTEAIKKLQAIGAAKTTYELAVAAPNLPSVDLMPCRYEIRIHEPGKTHNWVWSTHNNYARACAEFEAYADLACDRAPGEPNDLPGTLVQLRDLGEDRISSMTINDMTSE